MMTMRGMILGAALFAASGLSVLALAQTPKEPDPVAVESINKIADDVTKKDWAELSKEGAAPAKKLELVDVMNLMRKRDTKVGVKGLGVGAKAGKITPDGIEAKLINMTKNPMSKAILERDAADLIRMAERMSAVATVAVHQCTVDSKVGTKDPVEWKKWAEDMFKGSQDLIAALKKKDPVAVKEAANKLNGTCNDCHSEFK